MPDRSITRIRSRELGHEAHLARWGHYGQPVLLFPPAAGDASELERCGIVSALGSAIDSGTVKLFSVDGIPAQARLVGTAGSEDLAKAVARFDRFVEHEVVPWIREDCRSSDIEIVTAGPYLGAGAAIRTLLGLPEAVCAAVALSGIFEDDERAAVATASPRSRDRFVLLAHGAGAWERAEPSIEMARALERHGIPHRLDEWGEEYACDWPTWGAMLARYLEELV